MTDPDPDPRPVAESRRVATMALGLALLVVGLAGLALPLRIGAGPAGAAVPDGTTEDRLEAAAWWIVAEVDRQVDAAAAGRHVDVGVAADDVLALLAAGYGRESVERLLDVMGPATRAYVQADAPAELNPWVSGALAKTLATLQAAGRGGSYAGIDLEAELRANVRAAGRRAGEIMPFRNAAPHEGGQSFTQAWTVIALGRTGGGVPPSIVDWMLEMQCDGGAFRGGYPNFGDEPCPNGGHVDGTAMTIMALLTIPRTAAVATAIERAASWLETVQHADGGFDDNDKQPKNTNSTGLAAAALRATGRLGAAERARGWVESRQLLCGVAAEHRGAFSYSSIGEIPIEGGPGPRAIPQAVLALGLPPYGARGTGASATARPYHCPTDTGSTTPDSGSSTPDSGSTTPDSGSSTPDSGSTTPDSGSSTPDSGSTAPPRVPPGRGQGDGDVGGEGEGAGGGVASGSGPGGEGRAPAVGPATSGGIPAGGAGATASAPVIVTSSEPDEDAELRGRSSARADERTGDRPFVPIWGRPDSTATTDEPRAVGPFVLASAAGLVLVATSTARTGALARRGRTAATASSSSITSTAPDDGPARRSTGVGTSPTVPPDGPGVDVDLHTADLEAGPYG